MCNEGSAWGIIQDKNTIITLSIIILFILSYFWYTAKDKILKIGLGLIFLGGAFNLGERLYRGCVTDYIKVADRWPSFNIADIIIVIGILIILIKIIRKKTIIFFH